MKAYNGNKKRVNKLPANRETGAHRAAGWVVAGATILGFGAVGGGVGGVGVGGAPQRGDEAVDRGAERDARDLVLVRVRAALAHQVRGLRAAGAA